MIGGRRGTSRNDDGYKIHGAPKSDVENHIVVEESPGKDVVVKRIEKVDGEGDIIRGTQISRLLF